jgi:hypothetical protein
MVKKDSRTSSKQILKEFELTDKVSDRTVRRGVIDEGQKGGMERQNTIRLCCQPQAQRVIWHWNTVHLNGHPFIGRKCFFFLSDESA